MTYVITQNCCTDASCVEVCPVFCIHPTPEEPGFGTTETLHINPEVCINCGACLDACPVDAIKPEDLLVGAERDYLDVSRAWFEEHPMAPDHELPHFPRSMPEPRPGLRIAVVGTGPAAIYTARALLRTSGAHITLIDRSPTPGGLVRSGVAPDHPTTRLVSNLFMKLHRHPDVTTMLNVDVGTHVTHEELLAHHHAVVYAVGATQPRTLGVPGEDLGGVLPAIDVVRWYNSHPDFAGRAVPLDGDRVAVVGTGNVAIDIVRVLLGDCEVLSRTDIADHALEKLRESKVREVLLLARRGPADLACTGTELRALVSSPDIDVVVDDTPGVRAAIEQAPETSVASLLRRATIADAASLPPGPRPRVVLRFNAGVSSVEGADRVQAVVVRAADGSQERVPACAVVTAIGTRAAAVPGLHLDEESGTVCHDAGRALDAPGGSVMPGVYVVGWLKRGSKGGIGVNRFDAEETATTIVADAGAHALPEPTGTAAAFHRIVKRRQPQIVGRWGVKSIILREQAMGAAAGRPSVRFTTAEDALAAARRLPITPLRVKRPG